MSLVLVYYLRFSEVGGVMEAITIALGAGVRRLGLFWLKRQENQARLST
jgi:hypothetical protein